MKKFRNIEFDFSVKLPGLFKWQKKTDLAGLLFILSLVYAFAAAIANRSAFLRVLPSALLSSDSYSYLPLWAYYNTVRTPFYRLFLIVVCKLTGSYFYAVVFQHFFTVLAAALIAFTLWSALRKQKVGWSSLVTVLLLSCLVLFDNNLLMYEHWILTDYWLAILLLVIAASCGWLAHRPNVLTVLLVAGTVLLAFLIRPVGIYLLPLGLLLVLFIAWRQHAGVLKLGLVYFLVVVTVVLSFCYYNYRLFGYFGVSTNGIQQLFALVADAGALDMDSPANARYKKMIRSSYKHHLHKYPPTKVSVDGYENIGWPLYRSTPPDLKNPPPGEIIAGAVGNKESSWAPILQELAVEGLWKDPGRYLKFAMPYMKDYLTYSQGENKLVSELFYPAFDIIETYTKLYQTTLPSVSRNFPPLVPVFENYRSFYFKHHKQPWLQSHSLIFSWLLLPFVLFELIWPKVLSRENHAWLFALYLIAIGQALMGFFGVGTGRYILPMTTISYPCFALGLVVFILQMQHLMKWGKKRWAKK